MMHNPVISTPNTNPTGYSTRNKGIGRVYVQNNPDTITLKTGTDILMIKAPGHPFKDGDEVVFEFINNNIFLAKKTTPDNKTAFPIVADIYLKQNIIDKLSQSEILQAIATSIKGNSDDTVLTFNYIQQLSTAIETIPASEQTKTLLELIDTINKSNSTITPQQLDKLLNLIADLQKSISHVSSGQSGLPHLLAILDREIAEGIYQFNSINSTLQFLDGKESNDLKQYIQSLFENDGCVSIRIYATGEKSSCAQILNSSTLTQELTALIQTTVPEIIDTFPVTLFQKFIKENGQLDKSLLKLLSQMTIVQSGTPPLNGINLKQSGDAALLHWLLTVNEYRESASQLSHRIPSNSIATLRETLDNIQQQIRPQPLSLDDIGINISHDFGKNASAIFANKIKTLGFTLEHDLLSGTPPAPSLKTELLNAFAASQNHVVQSVPTKQTGVSIDKGTSIVAPSLKNLFSQINKVQLDLSTVAGTLKTPGVDIVQNIKNSMHTIIEDINKQYISSNVQTLPQSLKSPETPSPVPLNAQHVMIDTNISGLQTTITNGTQLLTSLFTATDGFSELETLRDAIIDLQSKLNSLINLTDGNTTISESNSKNLIVENSTALLLGQRLTELSESHEKLQSILKEVATTSGESQKPIESLLHRLESLQLLARQITTQDGTGHILALPVKIGDEWTEVTIRMIKKENSGKTASSTQKHYMVYLDIAPSQLGGIHATLSYEKGQNLAIQMQFENKEVTAWFLSNYENFRNSMKIDNIHFVTMDFKTMTPTVEPTRQDERSGSYNNIDIKV